MMVPCGLNDVGMISLLLKFKKIVQFFFGLVPRTWLTIVPTVYM